MKAFSVLIVEGRERKKESSGRGGRGCVLIRYSERERENGPLLGLVMMALVRRMNLVLETVEEVCLCVSCVWSGLYI